jgi:hypothetical protein
MNPVQNIYYKITILIAYINIKLNKRADIIILETVL